MDEKGGYDEKPRIDQVQFGDIQDIQVLQDKCHAVIQCLKINFEVSGGLINGDLERTKQDCSDDDHGPMQLQSLRLEARMQRDRTKSVVLKLECTIALVSTIAPLSECDATSERGGFSSSPHKVPHRVLKSQPRVSTSLLHYQFLVLSKVYESYQPANAF